MIKNWKAFFGVMVLILSSVELKAEETHSTIERMVEELQHQGIDTIVVHNYALFGGRFNIPYDNETLRCDGKPIVYYLIWKKGGKLFCKRIDDCGEFENLAFEMPSFDQVIASLAHSQVYFRKESAHYALYALSIWVKDLKNEIRVSHSQLKQDNTKPIRWIKKLNQTIILLEEANRFKRVKNK